ncbi:alpha-1,6-mannosyl-glycoprotein 2-beta-N-acetylglucosaminyltransferase isoform X2 [Physcomitrium patens]|uniref:alpha-1,6-mannosyl-glycoprotein 2-beta-N-acetylglucosaminyltransferase isoform X2 n=1 Tax=Physcomitrium patens TaxID=3218 RepID=UPI000D173C05|nr:alpha-1,6-mannosyl-glycoprotein 2-beta-N-acetylglucosaminyltransferase-like isoform X2 [Physcomitrium patens]|eukprot:XP_024389927.1 alpha-1,6-mannosyl-glycoprotein 2-beta-N-acetylglucosaminyltransferase-like isoform X2 [Physcomitrella patens]
MAKFCSKLRLAAAWSCGGCQLWAILLLQIFVLSFVVGPYLATTDGFNGLWGGANNLPGVGAVGLSPVVDVDALRLRGVNLPAPNELSKLLLACNSLPPRNLDLFPSLRDDRILIVLYVHFRPEYLKLAVSALSVVNGINETLLIVSHDGFYEEMNAVVESIRFCQVKQIFAPWSPHLYTDQFPGTSPGDCKDKDDAETLGCRGNPDQYGNHRSVRIVSLKHHWWWMMNTVWDGLEETRGFNGHAMFIEEDHYLLPNAYRNIQILAELKQKKCPYCIAANAAPVDVRSRGERFNQLVAEKIGNVGYTFNRTVWKRIHTQAERFCKFDDYNWDITMWTMIYPTFGDALYTLRGPRTSAVHFGKCGLHQGYSKSKSSQCRDSAMHLGSIEEADKVPNIDLEWSVRKYPIRGSITQRYFGERHIHLQGEVRGFSGHGI